jgi:hypothetical protein
MKTIKAIGTAPGQFTEGKSYKVDDEYNTHFVLIDDSGSWHHVRKDGAYKARVFG